MSLDTIYANIAAARLELGEIRNPPMQVRDAIKRLQDALLIAQGIDARSDETPKEVQPEGQEPGPEGVRPNSVGQSL